MGAIGSRLQNNYVHKLFLVVFEDNYRLFLLEHKGRVYLFILFIYNISLVSCFLVACSLFLYFVIWRGVFRFCYRGGDI